MTNVAQFFLDQWIWSISWGLYQSLASIVVLTLIFWIFTRYGLISSFFLVTVSQLFSLALLSLVVYGILIRLFGVDYDPYAVESRQAYTVFEAAASLGMVYSILQYLFFRLFRITFDIKRSIMFSLLFIGNMLGALWAYWCLPPLL